MKINIQRRLIWVLPLVLLGLLAVVIYPSLVTQAQAPYVYYSLYDNPWTLERRDADGSDLQEIYTSPADWSREIAVDHVNKIYIYDGESDSETILKADIDGSNLETFLSVQIEALAAGGGHVYYTLTDAPYSLMRRDADGTNPLTIYTPSTDWVYDVAVDFANNKLYFYDATNGSEAIHKSDLDGSNETTFVTAKIKSLAVGAGYVYYSLFDAPYSLIRRNADGLDPRTIYTPPSDWVRDIAVDPTNNKLYYYHGASGSETIYKSDLDGSNPEVFLEKKIYAMATHAESPTRISIQDFSVSENKEFINNLVLMGLISVILAGSVIFRRRKSIDA